MNPRLKTSKKWTAFPAEYVTQIKQAFIESFQGKLGEDKLIIEGRIYTEEILLRVGLLEKGRLKQANFEVSMNYSTKAKDAVERIHDCIDAAASMMNEYIETSEDEDVDFPLTWKEYEFNGRPLFVQYSTVNTDLEAQADALLGESANDLVQEDEEAQDALDVADEKIEDESHEKGPSMFGGGAKKKKKSDLH